MNIARLNMSHGDYAFHTKTIEAVREVNKQGYNIGLMLDTKGAEIRTGDLKKDLDIKRGDKFVFTTRLPFRGTSKWITISYDGYVREVKKDDIILIDGGILSFRVTGKTKTDIQTEALDNGKLTSRRHVNTKGKTARLPTITKEDWKDIDWGIKERVDFIALSFVKDRLAISQLKKYLLKNRAPISVIAKIESAASIKNLDDIITEADGIMVARGDLGSELPVEEVPLIQEEIVNKCLKVGKPVIVATHLLESMINLPTPTRAEVADIAHAVRQRTDALMLSGETAVGDHPFKSVIVMDNVARRMEKKAGEESFVSVPKSNNPKLEMVRSASSMANNIRAKAIIVFTKRGFTATLVSWCRPNSPIYAFTQDINVMRKLGLYWGVEANLLKLEENPERTVKEALTFLKGKGQVEKKDKVVIVSDILAGKEMVESVQIREIG